MKKIQYLLLCSLILLFAGCEKDTEATNFAPSVTTGNATDIYRKGAVLSGSIQLTGSATAKSYGILFSELESMAEYTEYPATDGSSEFQIRLTTLTPGTTYYYCAYANSSYSIAKGQVKNFSTTENNVPIFASISLSSTEVSSCKIAATLFDEGGSEIELSGFCWKIADEGEPTTNDHVQNVSISNGSMTTELTGLEPDTEYLIRAYATNHTGVGYSETLRVKTNPTLAPTVSTISQKEATDRSVTIEAMVNEEGTSAVTQVGFCWSTSNQTPTTNDEHADLTESYKGENNAFSLLMDELKLGTTYYIRAYATNEVGTTYSEVSIFTTADPQTPELSTTTQKESTDFTITVEAEITDGGTSDVKEVGFCWSAENKEPTLKDSSVKLTDQLKGDNKTFGTTLKDLKPSTTYYIRSYATNEEGTTYGEVITFTTAEAKAPALSATTQKETGNFSVSLETQITDAGTTAVTETGFCWSSTNKEPTIKDSHINLTSQLSDGKTTISTTLEDLKPGTTYYIRAYATNKQGTTYGDVITFTTAQAKAPTISVITKKASEDFSVTIEAQVTDAGTSDVNKAGFCWSTSNQNPTMTDTTKDLTSQLDGKNTTLSTTLSDLKPNTTYYIRAYAVNGEGTTYSETFTFKTGYKDTESGNTGIENLPTTEWK